MKVPSQHTAIIGASSLEQNQRYDTIIIDEEWYILAKVSDTLLFR